MCHNYWACALEPLSHNYWSPCSATREATATRSPRTAMKSSPRSLQLEKAGMQQWRPNAAKKKKKKIYNICHNRLISLIYKEVLKTKGRKPKPDRKQEKDMNRRFTKKRLKWPPKYKKWSNSLIIREMQVKTTLRYHFSSIRLAKIF